MRINELLFLIRSSIHADIDDSGPDGDLTRVDLDHIRDISNSIIDRAIDELKTENHIT